MYQYSSWRFVESWRLRKIANLVRSGITPEGVAKDRVFKALRYTKPKATTEVFGLLSAKLTKPDGTVVFPERLVSVREVTTAFAIRLVDGLMDSATTMSSFNQHKQGSGSTAETSADTALVTAQSGAQAATGGAAQTHGATSNIYRSVGTVTAATTYEIREHGVFNASTGGVLLDRSVVTGISVNTDDVVTWTYELTINAGG